MFSILHISDLHRSPDDPLSNEELLVSLATDRARYTRSDPRIRAPDAIVVSGDVIQGAGLGRADSKRALQDQYAVAEDFLARLADDFVDGDRSKVIVAPGNHDVDWNGARDAMELIPAAEEPNPMRVISATSNYRGSWKDKPFYRIVTPDLYERRLDAYWEFIERFYVGVNDIPCLARDRQFSLFSLFNDRIGVAVFNSCLGNDCFANHGAIEPSAIAAARRLMLSEHRFGLWIAVWHHSIQGAPYRSDYMDVEQVQNMVGYGFRLGLHGHQHKHQVTPMQVHLPDTETMLVVSAGSLCAGPNDLPTGFYRQYNIIEVADDLRSARVHVRQMETAHLFSGCHLTMAGGKTYIDIHWSPPVTGPIVRGRDDGVSPQVILDAERMAAAGNNTDAAERLVQWMPGLSGYGRTVFVQACVRACKWDWIIEKMGEPQSIDDLIALVEACDRRRLPVIALTALQAHGDKLEMPASQRRELEQRVRKTPTSIL
jgi:3',5'-cyclic AMP phosphodiesterase CpdA